MKLHDQVRNKLRLLHDAIDPEDCYIRLLDQFKGFHRKGNVWRFRKRSFLRCRLKRRRGNFDISEKSQGRNILKLPPPKSEGFPPISRDLLHFWCPVGDEKGIFVSWNSLFPPCGKIPPKKILHRYQRPPGKRKEQSRRGSESPNSS